LHRPAGVEGWLPIAGLMNLRYLTLTHHVPALHPAGMFLLIAFLAMSFLFRKYKDFLTLWKDPDPDIPILKEAKAEYAKLQ
jgi:hypothetical protein